MLLKIHLKEFDGAQFERRLLSGVLFGDTCGKFRDIHQTSGLISYYSMFAATEYFSVVGNSDCHQFSLRLTTPIRSPDYHRSCIQS